MARSTSFSSPLPSDTPTGLDALETALLADLEEMQSCAARVWNDLSHAGPDAFERFGVDEGSELPDFVWRAGVDYPEQDAEGFWATPSPLSMDGLFEEDNPSAHAAMRRQDDLVVFGRLLDKMASVAPIFARSHARFSVQMEPLGGAILTRLYCAGHAASSLDEAADLALLARRLASLVRALAPTFAPTGYWVVEPDHPPVPAASAVEALLLVSLLGSKHPSLPRALTGMNAAELHTVGRIDSPETTAQVCKRLLEGA